MVNQMFLCLPFLVEMTGGIRTIAIPEMDFSGAAVQILQLTQIYHLAMALCMLFHDILYKKLPCQR